MIFEQLLTAGGYDSSGCKKRCEINHICCDSRLAGPNSVFVCIRGILTDGHLYACRAYDSGCRCYVAVEPLDLPDDCDIIYTGDTRLALARLSDIVYDHPSGQLRVIGITGTKGKTTIALTVKGILDSLGLPTGYIGSNGIMYGRFRHSSINTTPESCDIQRYLRDMADAGMKYAVIEVSSQALYLGRVRFIQFDTCVFTNLYPDHISNYEHPNFEHYRDCKAKLFSEFSPRYAVVNADDPYSEYMLHGCSAEIITYGLTGPAMHSATDLTKFRTRSTLGMRFTYRHDGLCLPAEIRFPGEFSVSNALAALAICRIYSDDVAEMVRILETITVTGRFELVTALPYATIIIDYAHNGASMTSVLEALHKYNHRKIITLFGSVGGRTQMRRAELGRVASELSDFCILTSDNPDREDPLMIIRDIALNFGARGCGFEVIIDRREAIVRAMSLLKTGDILVLAGKGHEDYQLINGIKVPFCEREIVMQTAKEMLKAKV